MKAYSLAQMRRPGGVIVLFTGIDYNTINESMISVAPYHHALLRGMCDTRTERGAAP